MRWPWRRRYRAKLNKLTLPYVTAERIRRNRWRIEVSSAIPGCDPIEYDFWGTDDNVRAKIEEEFAAIQMAHRAARKARQAAQVLQKIHKDGRHTGSMANCPRCQQVLGSLGKELF